jgi:hypothetical protein
MGESAMIRALVPLLLVIAPLIDAGQLPPDAPGPVVTGPSGIVAAGDTLIYTISWGAGARATSYDYAMSVTSTNGAWSVVADSNGSGKWTNASFVGIGSLPITPPVTGSGFGYTFLKTWLSAIPWDSATFTVAVNSRNAAGTSAAVSASWKVTRKPGVPGPIKVDSSLVVTGMLVLPNTVNLALGGSRIQCAFKQFGNGAITEWTADKASCDSIYVAYVPAAARGLVTPAQQAHTDSVSLTCVTWNSSSPAVSITPLAHCSSAALAVGLALTWQAPADALRYAVR